MCPSHKYNVVQVVTTNETSDIPDTFVCCNAKILGLGLCSPRQEARKHGAAGRTLEKNKYVLFVLKLFIKDGVLQPYCGLFARAIGVV